MPQRFSQERPASGGIPDLYCAVPRSGGEGSAVPAESQSADFGLVLEGSTNVLSGPCLPESDCAILTGCCRDGPVRAEAHLANRPLVLQWPPHRFSRGRIPQVARVIIAACQDGAAVWAECHGPHWTSVQR